MIDKYCYIELDEFNSAMFFNIQATASFGDNVVCNASDTYDILMNNYGLIINNIFGRFMGITVWQN